jgi:hypothetical protein
MSMATGKRINVVHLGINAAGLAPVNVINTFGFDGILGWYDHRNAGSWAPSLGTEGIYSRFETLIRYCLPNAMAAEGNTKTPKFLAMFWSQGETDALSTGSRLHYGRSLRNLKASIRNLIKGLGYSPYTNGAEMPWIQPKIMRVAYELKGIFDYYGTLVPFDGDGEGLVNNAIVEEAASDEFSAWIYTDDLPRKLPDGNHLNGVGECARGARTAQAMTLLVDHALGFGSDSLTNKTPELVDICNRALSLMGESPVIQSIDEDTEQARLCRLFLPEARDTLLQMRKWSFATRRVALTPVKMPDQPVYSQFGFCYVMPPEALNAFAVLPPDEVEEEFDFLSVAKVGYSDAFVDAWDEGPALTTEALPGYTSMSELPLVSEDDVKPQPFRVERSPIGGRYIFTNQEQATLQFVQRVVDASEYSSSFSEALSAYLAAKLAGSLIKGANGVATAKEMMQLSAGHLRHAGVADASSQRRPHDPFDFVPSHMSNR